VTLAGSKVTDRGVTDLKRAVPKLWVFR
jgi:hypothetical protein